jgi:hypothetical protein
MARMHLVLSRIYLAIAGLALVATWRQNIGFIVERDGGLSAGLVDFWPALLANRATTSITVDIFLFGLAAVVWMVVEARRREIRLVWVYVLLSFAVAISVTFPLFLAARERRLHALGEAEAARLAPRDLAGLGLLSAAIVGFSLYSLIR